MAKTMTVESLQLLIAIETLGPDVTTNDAADWLQKVGARIATVPGSKKPLLQGSLRQALRAHLKQGRIKYRKAPGLAHAGEIYLWTVTAEGRAEISHHLRSLRRITAMGADLEKRVGA